MTRYLLPCPCSCRIAVGAGQAGGTVRCPDCGTMVSVPRLGDLARLDRAGTEPVDAPARGWTAAQAGLRAGIIVACGAAALAAGLRTVRGGVAPIDEQGIRAAVAAAAADQVHASWQRLARQRLERPSEPEEDRRIRQAKALGALESVAWTMAAAGALVAVGAALVGGRSLRHATGRSAAG